MYRYIINVAYCFNNSIAIFPFRSGIMQNRVFESREDRLYEKTVRLLERKEIHWIFGHVSAGERSSASVVNKIKSNDRAGHARCTEWVVGMGGRFVLGREWREGEAKGVWLRAASGDAFGIWVTRSPNQQKEWSGEKAISQNSHQFHIWISPLEKVCWINYSHVMKIHGFPLRFHLNTSKLLSKFNLVVESQLRHSWPRRNN